MKVELISITRPFNYPGWEPEDLIEHAGRVCYNSEDNMFTNPNFIKSRIDAGHESIIEFVDLTFLIDGISRACSHQLVRHRLCSYAQRSLRYTKRALVQDMVPPPNLTPEQAHVVHNAYSFSAACYDGLIAQGMSPEDARFVLPMAHPTTLLVKANCREWRHIFTMRCSKKAQWEIRNVSLECLKICYDRLPQVFEDLYQKFVVEQGQ